MIKKLIITAAGAAALSIGFSTASFAGDAQLRYASVELTTQSGAMDVYHRIQKVAAETCDARLNHDSVIKYSAVRESCVANAVDELVARVNDERIDSIHAGNV
ncbi:UrcA family protein [Hyphococcus luteus]|nr:UrcA family protein [Marinicaulis flavus]